MRCIFWDPSPRSFSLPFYYFINFEPALVFGKWLPPAYGKSYAEWPKVGACTVHYLSYTETPLRPGSFFLKHLFYVYISKGFCVLVSKTGGKAAPFSFIYLCLVLHTTLLAGRGFSKPLRYFSPRVKMRKTWKKFDAPFSFP